MNETNEVLDFNLKDDHDNQTDIQRKLDSIMVIILQLCKSDNDEHSFMLRYLYCKSFDKQIKLSIIKL